MPPPPADQEDAWREQVRLFIVQHLQRAVDDVQPCLLGLGFYRLRSATARAAIVDHGPYELQHGVFVRFINHDDRDNHRVVQGFGQGWLMLLGVPLDYRNEYDIANAIAGFGKYHHWHQDDEVLERTMVYASFTSLALVPRDVVFGHYANLGAVKQSWTDPCYILMADFVDILPADEDQMPANGNPHPMLGHLHPDGNNFAVPQFPELGWNDIEDVHQPAMHEPGFFQPEDQEQHNPEDHIQPEQPEEEQVDSSIINASGDSVGNAGDGEGEVNQIIVNLIMLHFDNVNHTLAGSGTDMIYEYLKMRSGSLMGPALPPAMQLASVLNFVMVASSPLKVPVSVPCFDGFSDDLNIVLLSLMKSAAVKPAAFPPLSLTVHG
jgi:hypothetical protein